jgi:hypothetical protein
MSIPSICIDFKITIAGKPAPTGGRIPIANGLARDGGRFVTTYP